MKLRVGIIGAGGIAQGRHIPAFQSLSEKAEVKDNSDVNGMLRKVLLKNFTYRTILRVT